MPTPRRTAGCLLAALLAVSPLLAANADTGTWEDAYVGSDTTLLYLPDANAVYWRYGWTREPGERTGIAIRGRYPDARYFSFNIYDDDVKQSVGSVTDIDITPEAGGVNPFEGQGGPAGADGGLYTLYILPDTVKVDAPNVLHFPDDLTNVSVFLRHYLAKGDILGGAPLPLVSMVDMESGTVAPAAASNPIPKLSRQEVEKYLLPLAQKLKAQYRADPEGTIAAMRAKFGSGSVALNSVVARQVVAKTFEDFTAGEAIPSYNYQTDGTYPNKDNLYLVIPAIRAPGQSLLVRFRAPRYSPSPDGYAAADVRYFSVSQGDDATYNFATLADRDMAIGDDGMIEIIIGDDSPALRAKADALGANFMPWLVGEKMLLVYRHMLPRADFANGIDKVPAFDRSRPKEGQEGAAFIGDYAPVGLLVDTDALLAMPDLPDF
jgi:hypothetical protein